MILYNRFRGTLFGIGGARIDREKKSQKRIETKYEERARYLLDLDVSSPELFLGLLNLFLELLVSFGDVVKCENGQA